MVETITDVNLPKELSVTYDTGNVFNTAKNRFEKLSDYRTPLLVDAAYRFKGIMKLMALLMPWVFKKQTRIYLADFKSFAKNKVS